MEPPYAVTIPALERQLREGARRLRFAPELEQPFLADLAGSIASRRLALLYAALILIGLTPLLNAFVLHPPEEFEAPALLAQFGVMIPALLAGIVVTRVPRLRRWQDPVAALVAIVVTAGIMFQRHVGAKLGFAVPVELVGVVFLGAAVLAGLRIAWFAPMALAIVVAFAVVEIATFGASASVLNTLSALVMMAILASIGAWMEERNARAAWLQRRLLEQLAIRDPLTGLANARAFRESWPRLHAAAARDGQELLAAVVDIDYFKHYNDRYGHPAGDECLRQVAAVLQRHGRRASDLQARMGGDEFVLVWYGTGAAHGAELLEAVRAEVERLAIVNTGAPGRGMVTLSIGAIVIAPQGGLSPDTALAAADRQLYRAKERGRNQVALSTVQE